MRRVQFVVGFFLLAFESAPWAQKNSMIPQYTPSASDPEVRVGYYSHEETANHPLFKEGDYFNELKLDRDHEIIHRFIIDRNPNLVGVTYKKFTYIISDAGDDKGKVREVRGLDLQKLAPAAENASNLGEKSEQTSDSPANTPQNSSQQSYEGPEDEYELVLRDNPLHDQVLS